MSMRRNAIVHVASRPAAMAPPDVRFLDIDAGNGHVATLGFDVKSIEPSHERVAAVTFEHVYSPRKQVVSKLTVLKRSGIPFLSVFYRGHSKNLALALSGRLDRQFTALRDHDHIRFYSVKTFTRLLSTQVFRKTGIDQVGRTPYAVKSPIMTQRAPS